MSFVSPGSDQRTFRSARNGVPAEKAQYYLPSAGGDHAYHHLATVQERRDHVPVNVDAPMAFSNPSGMMTFPSATSSGISEDQWRPARAQPSHGLLHTSPWSVPFHDHSHSSTYFRNAIHSNPIHQQNLYGDVFQRDTHHHNTGAYPAQHVLFSSSRPSAIGNDLFTFVPPSTVHVAQAPRITPSQLLHDADLCLWDGGRCNMFLQDRAFSAIGRHLRDHHSTGVWAGKESAVCQWLTENGPCGRRLQRNGFGKHIATVHLRATVTVCPQCGKDCSRHDVLMRHLQYACPNRVPT